MVVLVRWPEPDGTREMLRNVRERAEEEMGLVVH